MSRSPQAALKWLSLTLVALSLAGCATQRVRAEREAIATYNRCVMALKSAEPEAYESCLSASAKLQFEEDYVAEASVSSLDRQAWIRGLADASPYRTEILQVRLNKDLDQAFVETRNRSGVIDEPVDHHEVIVLIKESGRWVIDKDCCEYSNARFAGPVIEEAPETVPLPQ